MSVECMRQEVGKMARILSASVACGEMQSTSARYRLRQTLNDAIADHLAWLHSYMRRSVNRNLDEELEWPDDKQLPQKGIVPRGKRK